MRKSIFAAVVASLLTAVAVVQAQVPGVNSTLNSVFTLAYDNSTMKPTYSATVAGIAAVSSQTDMCSLQGSATKTLKVRRVWFDNLSTGAVTTEPITILTRTTANSGAGSAMIKSRYDTNNAASTTALAEVWTAAPTTGTLGSIILDYPWTFGGTTALDRPMVVDFGRLGSPVVLRGVAQSIAINLSGITLTGTVSCTFEWTEDSD
ncbi:MAG: hypothetical protein E6Q97_19180 [Desulfurellales bacterium]|nr:MAG: hypothetical protein E6Q97_19180 [Desulfurellales bacterium]